MRPAARPVRLLQLAGWLSVLLMLVLASPGVRIVESPEAPRVAQDSPF